MSTTDRHHLEFRRCTLGISGLLVTAAVVYLGYHLGNAFDSDDAGRLETLLIGSVAGELKNGLSTLYGPYTGENRLVLIHAPLFYRLAALAALPVAEMGLAATEASLVGGRLISVLSTLGLLVFTFRLATIDGASRRAGFWAVCLLASSPVLGVLAVMVRPDALAVFFQTLGVFLVVRTLREEAPSNTGLVAGYLALALGFCSKQHQVAGFAVSSVLLLVAWRKQTLAFRPIVLAHLAVAAIVGLYLGSEEFITHGMMSRSVFVLPGGVFRKINYASWLHVKNITLSIVKLSAGVLALGAVCACSLRIENVGRRLDGVLWLYFLAETAWLVPLCLYNKGAAENYALQAVVFACILVGRALARALEYPTRWKVALLISTAAFVLVRDIKLIMHNASSNRADRIALQTMLADRVLAYEAPAERYFVDLPQHNRRFGAIALIHDEWLFGAYEFVGEVELRSAWMRSALVNGPVHTIIVPDNRQTIPGLLETLPELGYLPINQFGRYRVWERLALESP